MRDKYKFTCKICKRRAEERCIISHFTGREMAGIPHPYPETIHILACIECAMSYNAQFYEMTNKEIQDWALWILTVFNDYKTESKTGGKKNGSIRNK